MGVGHNFLDNVSEVVMMDIGGASTELIRVGVSPFKYKDSVSLPMGSVRATQWRLSGNFNENVSYVFKSCQKILNYKTSKLVCVAGTMTALGAMIKGLSHFEAEKINGQEVSYPEFKKFVQKIEDDTVDKIVENYPFLGKRAQSIVGGAWVACQLCEILGVTSIEISTRGLRHGTLMAANGIDEKFIVGEV
jgi:exopolyphosphatase/guanosine-5'-triphosphate,3'-diphosphate pyrophosphatase